MSDIISPAEFRDACDRLAREFSLSITSWRRTDEHSVAVGSFKNDPHAWGAGVDCLPILEGAQLDRFDDRARALLVKVVLERDHMHLQPLDWPAGPVTAAPTEDWTGMHA